MDKLSQFCCDCWHTLWCGWTSPESASTCVCIGCDCHQVNIAVSKASRNLRVNIEGILITIRYYLDKSSKRKTLLEVSLCCQSQGSEICIHTLAFTGSLLHSYSRRKVRRPDMMVDKQGELHRRSALSSHIWLSHHLVRNMGHLQALQLREIWSHKVSLLPTVSGCCIILWKLRSHHRTCSTWRRGLVVPGPAIVT